MIDENPRISLVEFSALAAEHGLFIVCEPTGDDYVIASAASIMIDERGLVELTIETENGERTYLMRLPDLVAAIERATGEAG